MLAVYGTGSISGTLAAASSGTETSPSAGLSLPGASVRTAYPTSSQTQRIIGLAPVLGNAAQRYGIDPLLLHAIAHVESRHQAEAISPAGARGLMQVMPATARRFGLTDPVRELMQAPLNVEVSAAYLKTLQARFGNDLPLVLAAYNAGEGAVERNGRQIPPYAETRAYVRQVLDAYDALRQLTRGVASR